MVRSETDATARKLADREARIAELKLTVQLVTDEAGRAGVLQKPLDAETGENNLAKQAFEIEEAALKAKEQKPVAQRWSGVWPMLRSVEERG